jgi:D-alanyl-D-alanine dipeptidase
VEIASNPKYVIPLKDPIHNREEELLILLVDKTEKSWIYTNFDFFGIEASHFIQNYHKSKRQQTIIKKNNDCKSFTSFDSEWWHYNLKAGFKDNVSNLKFRM